jgi:hypothetical protein
LTGDAVFWKASELAELIELAASDDVKWVWYREAVADVLVADVVFLHMEHVDTNDAAGGLVVEAGDASAEVSSE